LGLLEPRSGQSLTLPLAELTRIEARTSPLRPAPYLVLLRQDGRQLVLADVGFAFAPLTHNSGPLPELPETVCFADLDTLLAGVAQLTTQGRVAEATRGVLACIALVDGARACGFQVGREESRLEAALTRLERG
ncbi:MAG: hypothetical protein JST92_15610, partial [Deltaproteobacteria bacterium]|nr:hypothetical protein [Deltaproteobacteria bacterium]